MKSYTLFLHYKQGDDLAEHVRKTDTVTDAFRAWGADFEKRKFVCDEIATALAGQKVEFQGGTHMIMLVPLDDAADHALQALVKRELVSVDESDDMFDDE